MVTQSLPGEGLGWARWGSEISQLGSCPQGAEGLAYPPGAVMQPGGLMNPGVWMLQEQQHVVSIRHPMTRNASVIVTEKDK